MSTTGLSKATVSRVVEELRVDGFLTDGLVREQAGRGRPSTYLDLADGLGHVVGIDLGATTCRLWASDLRGRTLGRALRSTPPNLAVEAYADWLLEQMGLLHQECHLTSTPVAVAVGLPARVIGTRVVHPTAAVQALEGEQFHALLHSRLGVPLLFDTDANMALLGEMTEGTATDARQVALLSISTAFATAAAVDGTILHGRSPAFGEMSALPVGPSGDRLGTCLSVDGLLDTARRLGHPLERIDNLWASPPEAVDTDALITAFIDALTTATGIVAVTTDPEIVVFNGRLLPLIEHVLPEVEERLTSTLSAVPRLMVTQSEGFSGARGALQAALSEAQQRVLERVLRRPDDANGEQS